MENPAQFNPDDFNQAIARRGQYVRWKQSITCYCSDDLGRPDPNCMKCRGRGVIYYPVITFRTIEEGMSLGGTIIHAKSNIVSIEKLYNYRTQRDIGISSFSGNTIHLTTTIQRNTLYCLVYKVDLTDNFKGAAILEGKGIIRADLPDLKLINNQKVVGEIIKINSLRNTTIGQNINILDFWDDMILTDSSYEAGQSLEIDCDYVSPIRFLITNISYKRQGELKDLGQRADLQATVPSYHDIGDNDMIYQLSATQRMSVIGTYVDNFKLPTYDVSEILRIEDSYGEITGASVIRNNQISWGDKKPVGKFSISFLYHPVYTVNGDLSDPRNMEDKVFARRIILKKWSDSFGDIRPNTGGLKEIPA